MVVAAARIEREHVIQFDKTAFLNVMQISPKKSEQLMIIIKQQKNLWKCIKKSHKDIQTNERQWGAVGVWAGVCVRERGRIGVGDKQSTG